jgi:DNA-binding CsgD family transcriptional regulator
MRSIPANMFSADARVGFVLMDSSGNPVAFNAEAVRILTYPEKPESINRMSGFLDRQIRCQLFKGKDLSSMPIAPSTEFVSGGRNYVCRLITLRSSEKGSPPQFALLLQRRASRVSDLADIFSQFKLTRREREVVTLLFDGLTSKEIAARLNISGNTVKSHLRLVMTKLGASTRAGILGKIAGDTG